MSSLYAESPTAVAVAGPPVLQLSNFDLAPLGYRTDEFFVSGTASSYKLTSSPTADGRWNVVPAETVPYTTRIVTVRPSDPKKFNGTVVVEWLNVSLGADFAADWIGLHREILRTRPPSRRSEQLCGCASHQLTRLKLTDVQWL